ncbi:MAG: branched-chain amino acid aminotransferase, partial [Thermoprotei archaeon]
YLNNILAKIEAITAGVDEAIMLSLDGYVAEATGENIFLVKNNTLITPPTSAPILAGITRASIIELSEKLGIPVAERPVTPDELYTADEVFLCGTAAEIRPVVEIDGRTIGSGEVGPVTRKIIDHFDEYIRMHLTPVYTT